MILDLSNNHLYTDGGVFIKALHCPKQVSHSSLLKDQKGSSICKECSKVIHDTSKLSDEDVSAIVQNDASVCFSVSPTQSNLSVSLYPVKFTNKDQKANHSDNQSDEEHEKGV